MILAVYTVTTDNAQAEPADDIESLRAENERLRAENDKLRRDRDIFRQRWKNAVS